MSIAGAADIYPEALKLIITALISGDERTASSIVDEIAFTPTQRPATRWPSRSLIATVYSRDRYQCDYCGQKVILTAVMRLIARLYPGQFPYHPNWKVGETHPAIAARSATLDHLNPIALGGDPVKPENLVTACWSCNTRKGDLTIETLGWSLQQPSDSSWRGLTELYELLWAAAGRPTLGTDEMAWLRILRSQTGQ